MDQHIKGRSSQTLPDEFLSDYGFGGPGPLTCPNCGSDEIKTNHVEEATVRRAAQYATTLRELGRFADASDLLARLASVRILNFLRKRWRCACGAHFDE